MNKRASFVAILILALAALLAFATTMFSTGLAQAVEVKRSTDTRIRREVVGQMLGDLVRVLKPPPEELGDELETGALTSRSAPRTRSRGSALP